MNNKKLQKKQDAPRVSNRKPKQLTVTLVGVFLMFLTLVSSMRGAQSIFGEEKRIEEVSVPKIKSPDDVYPWYGYDSYDSSHPYYERFKVAHDLRVNLNGSKSYQVYCFNINSHYPNRKNAFSKQWFKRVDGTGDVFTSYAKTPRVSGEELNKKLLSVMYNAYPKNANGYMDNIEPLNAILVTQYAVWYYSDSSSYTVNTLWDSEVKEGKIKSEQVMLMREALSKLIDPKLEEIAEKKLSHNSKLNIFVPQDKSVQNLLSAEYVPESPPAPGQPPLPPVQTKKTTVIIRKYAKGDYSKLLEGATFSLTSEDVPNFEPIIFQSNSIGKTVELLDGTYTLTETAPPNGYEIAKPTKFRVKQGDVSIVQEDGTEIQNPNKEVAEPYSVEGYDDRSNDGQISSGRPYGKFYYAKNKDKSSQVVYCFNADLHSPPESEDGGGTIDPDISTMKEVKYTHTAGSDLFKYALRPRDTNPEDFLKHVKKVIEKGYKKKGDSYNGLTETQFRAATQLAIYYFTDSVDLTKDRLKDFHGFGDMNDQTLGVAKKIVEYALSDEDSKLTNLDFFVPNNSKYQSLIGTEYHPDDLVDVIRMEDKKQEVIPVTHSLTVKKTVVGELGDKTKGFQFELELKDKTGQPIVNTLKTNNQDLVAKDGKYSFNLKHGDTIRIEGLPTGYSYTLKETEAKDYIVTVDNKVSQEAQSASENVTADKEVTFENRKDLVPPTGLTTDGAIYLWLLLLVPLGLWVWLFGRKGLKND
ncbi:pilus ancillary protein 1 [Streptococcus pyogenes]|uniref:pilus ancillary protein 1 n=1 Tax=Streptococcus pyogenes TaxID=1314 RepID=UPI00035838C5|nr:pilus ancillary protein 1 [Streptococcus pyogenes]HER4796229.1 pilus ancillary protein 1 [Streptococcus pyogenes NGAS128]AGQ28401.1 fibronectin-binding protein [Streptococcus pyogenes HSC5]OLO16705.1 fibronectin-binding protein [Streptococcus pyogenes]SUO54473.1 fibronectin-binding protein [Streptococcus pyogenes]HEP1261267.1 pilus ancillary protein 1 [Streptococcus pyogenes]